MPRLGTSICACVRTCACAMACEAGGGAGAGALAGVRHEIDVLFEDAISKGLEGILAKRLEGVYQAGARGWNWIKYKRSYSGSLEDTIDTIVMGYYLGRGKRTSFGIGAFLIGIYDDKKDMFVTVAKI